MPRIPTIKKKFGAFWGGKLLKKFNTEDEAWGFLQDYEHEWRQYVPAQKVRRV